MGVAADRPLDRAGRLVDRLSVALFAAIAYVPALLSSPGRMPADTKLYLYLDPGRLVRDAPKAWDPSQFGGWVPHQMLSYLWPSGPWFWLCEQVGLPDWVAHRLWIGTILFLGGWGAQRLARTLGMAAVGALVVGFVYQVSPYVLPYVSRTSLMLLPWAALPWLTLLTVHSVRRGGWRYPALLALVVATVAGVNATAFAMILAGPILWVLTEWHAGRVTTRQVATASGRIGVLSVGVSVWWVAMLSIQGTYGADVLAYSETLDAVSLTSTSTEVMRSLGYWLFYIRDPYAPATTSALPYQESGRLILIGFVLLLVCAAGLVFVRWAHRRFAVLLVLAGLILSVGVHPFADPAPALSVVRDTGIGLALRSSTRALPLLTLGLAFGAATLVLAAAAHRRRLGHAVLAAVVLLTALDMPSLWKAQLVDAALERDEQPPSAWADAVADMDGSDPTARILQLPGAEFGAFRWGYTVDQPLTGITEKPLITRDLLPLGSAQVMDLLYALDNRAQTGTLDMAAVAPVARFLGADRVWLTNDLAFDRFRTPRPEVFADEVRTAGDVGLGDTTAYGDPVVNTPDIPMVDEQSLTDPRIGTPLAPVEVAPVDDPVAVVRIGTRLVVLDGSGDGIVAAAAAGLLRGDETVRYVNDLTDAELDALPDGTVLIVTDSNRDRDQQWRGSQDALGMTESGGPSGDGVTKDAGDQRLPVFTGDSADDADRQTVARLDRGLVVEASTYGEPFAFLPEYRAAMAVDGDPSTAWLVGQRWNPVGEHIVVQGRTPGALQLLQAQGDDLRVMITSVDIDVDGQVQHVLLGPESLTAPGQTVAVPDGDKVTITITGTAGRPGAPETGTLWVGFAELGPVAQEWVRPPLTAMAHARVTTPIALVFHRERVRATDRWRSDPEPRLARAFTVQRTLDGDLTVTLRLNQRTGDAIVDQLAGRTGTPTSNRRIAGSAAARASAAFDGDPATRWLSPFNTVVGSELTVPVQADGTWGQVRLLQPLGLSRITQLQVTRGDQTETVDVPVPDADGASTIDLSAFGDADAGDAPLVLGIAAIDVATTVDRRYGETVVLPVGLAEIEGLPVADPTEAAPPECRDDLLTVDGQPVPLQVDHEALLAGEAVEATTCDGEPLRLGAGEHRLLSAPGAATGIDVDDLAVVPGAANQPDTRTAPSVTVDERSSTSATVTVGSCPEGCWLIFGQGANSGWHASAGGKDLGEPTPVSGGASGWYLPASLLPAKVAIEFEPQGTLNIALGLSAATAIACLVLAAGRRWRGTAAAPEHCPATFVDPRRPEAGRRSSAWAGLAVVVATLLFVAPWWAALAVLPAVAVALWRRPRLLGAAGMVGIAALGALIVRRQLVYRYPASAAWPGAFESLHRPGLFAMMLLGVALFAADPAPDTSPAPEPDDADDDAPLG